MTRASAAVLTAAFCCWWCALCTPVHAETEMPLENPGFEEGRQGWSAQSFERFENLLTIDRTTARTGGASLKISGGAGHENPWLPQGVEDLRGGATYELGAWVHGQGQAPPPLAALKIEFYNAEGENTSGHYARQPATPGDWQQIRVRARADADTTRAAVLVRLFGRGAVWFDDVQFVMVEPAPHMTLSPERQVAGAGTDVAVSLVAHLAQDTQGEGVPPLDVSVVAPDGARLALEVGVTRRDTRTLALRMTLPDTVTGEYRVEAALDKKEPPAVARVFVPVQDRKPRNLTEDGVILARGEPFFPIGLYHVGVRDYETVARRGFNTVQGLATDDLEALGRSLDAALAAGLMVDVPLYGGGLVRENLPSSLRKLERFSGHSAVLNWKIIDEPDLRPGVRDEVPEVYQALRAADPQRPILLTIATPATYPYWAHFCDILQVDPYPLPAAPLTLVSDCVARGREALQPWQNLTAVLQAGWTREPLNQPSYAQARVMLYLALVNGAKGIFWYSFRDPGWRLEETPLWGRFDDINRETALLARPMMLGTRPEGVSVEAEGDGLQWTARDLEGRRYVLVVNPGEDALDVTVDPGRAVTEASAVHGTRLRVEDGKVRLQLPPTGADTVVLPAPVRAGPEPGAEAVEGQDEAGERPERPRGRRTRGGGE